MFKWKLNGLTSIMLVLVMIFAVGCSGNTVKTSSNTDSKEKISSEKQLSKIIDMAGREIQIPKEIRKVYGVNNNSTYLLYTIVPDKIIGWNLQLTEDTKKYIPKEFSNYPVVGTMYGNGKLVDAEEILKHSPDVVVLADTKISEKIKESAESIQDKLGVPVVVVEANINNYDKAYEFLGKLFNKNDKAKELGDYYKESYEYAKEKSNQIKNKIKVYYAREDNGLSTDFKGSSHTEVLDLVGGENIAVLKPSDKGNGNGSGKGDGSGKGNGGGLVQSGTVSIEQILLWNPEVILVGYSGSEETKALNTIKTDKMWAKTDAVKNGEVYEIPHAPFNWFDRPPSVNRIIGIKWLGNLLYPDVYNFNVKEEVKKFFKLFYNYDLNDDEVRELMNISK